ncbi:MAG: TRAP transporter substrate-binding protein [Pseudomonadota bacterium]
MTKRKPPISNLVLIALYLTLAPALSSAQVKIALSSTADSQRSGPFVWAQAFASELNRAGMKTTIYPSSTLGNEIVRTEQILLGLLEVNVTGNHEVEMFSELFASLELPFLFESVDEINALVDQTDFLDQVNASALDLGMRVVDFASLGGMSGLFTTHSAVRRLEDVAPLRLRAMSAQQLEYLQNWGSAGTQVAWEEVPQALQTGIAHGYLNPPIVAVQFGHGGQLNYYTDLRFQPSMRTVVVSEKWYQGLDPAQQQVVERAIQHARAAMRDWNKTTEATEFQMLRDIGIEIIELSPEERERFKRRVMPLYSTMASEHVVAKMRELLSKAKASR